MNLSTQPRDRFMGIYRHEFYVAVKRSGSGPG